MAAALARARQRRRDKKEWQARWPIAMDADVYAAVLRRREREAGHPGDVQEVELSAMRSSDYENRPSRTCDANTSPAASPSIQISTMDLAHPKLEEFEFTESELMLRQDFCKNKVCWYDHWYKDLWCFLINMNPLLSICYSHPLHPIGRKERLLVYAVSFIWVSLVSISMEEAHTCVECGFMGCDDKNGTCEAAYNTTYQSCHNGTHSHACRTASQITHSIFKPGISHWEGVEFDPATHQFTVNFCCIAESMWAIWFLETFNGERFEGLDLGGPLYALVANTVFSILCFQLMLCGCVQFASYKRRKCGERIGYIIFGIITFMLLSTVSWLLPYVMQRENGMWGATRNFVYAKTGSWIGATFFNVFVFAIIWPMQRPHARGPLKWMDPPRYPLPDHRGPVAKAACPRFHVLASEYIEYVRPEFDPDPTLGSAKRPSFFGRATKPIPMIHTLNGDSHSATSSKHATLESDLASSETGSDGDDPGLRQALRDS